MAETSLPALLRERASLQPNDTAFTFIDYDEDPGGVPETLTWLQVYRRALNVARELRLCAAPGDRAVILAPQGLDYIVAFLGALQAGLIAVPLTVPHGAGDERVGSVLRDASPTAVLTTSAVIGEAVRAVTPPGTPRRRSSRLIYWIWMPAHDSTPETTIIPAWRICNTRLDRRGTRPAP